MAFGAVRHSSAVLPCRSRSGRPRPASFLGILAFLSCGGWCLRPCFCSHPSDSGAGGGGGGGGSDDDGEDAEAPLVPTKANNPTGAEGIHSNGIKNDELTMLDFLALLDNRLMIMCDILSRIENCIASNRHPSTAPVQVTGTPANKDAVNRKKILEELKKGSVPENGMLLEKPESEAASASALDGGFLASIHTLTANLFTILNDVKEGNAGEHARCKAPDSEAALTSGLDRTDSLSEKTDKANVQKNVNLDETGRPYSDPASLDGLIPSAYGFLVDSTRTLATEAGAIPAVDPPHQSQAVLCKTDRHILQSVAI
ncbi:hypothetical protein BAE44_0019393, partial [Dichanthelium oligosanthes]